MPGEVGPGGQGLTPARFATDLTPSPLRRCRYARWLASAQTGSSRDFRQTKITGRSVGRKFQIASCWLVGH